MADQPETTPTDIRQREMRRQHMEAKARENETTIQKAKQIDPWAWTSYAFGTSDRELYLALKARREASVKAAEKELQNG